MNTLPKFLEDKIANPPPAGSGVHAWLFDVSRNLHAHMPAVEIENLLRSKLANCGRKVPDRELKAAIADSIKSAWTTKGDAGRPSNKPIEPNVPKIEWNGNAGKRSPDLFHASPFTFDADYNCEMVIDWLFPGDPLLCCGLTAWDFANKPRSEWRGGLEKQSYLVPSPMNAMTGLTQEGKISAHCINNTGDRRFLIVEFDFTEQDKSGKETMHANMLRRLAKSGIGVHDLCASLLFALNEIAPMTMVVDSGGKSLHGWWFVGGVPEYKLKSFWNHALELGADPKTWLKSQFVRMPDGTRDNGKRQPVLYFNPSTIKP